MFACVYFCHVCLQIIQLAVQEGLVTQHTASVGVLLQKQPADPTKTVQAEVPLKAPHGRSLFRDDVDSEEEEMG
jgi:hypothetical protein